MGQAMRNDTDQIVAEVEESGVCIVPNFISADLLGRIRDDLDRLNDLERQHGVAFLESDGANQRVFNLVNKGEVFEEIVQHPDVMVVMDKLLGGDFILSGFSSNTTGPGGEEMTLHSDSGYVPPPHPEYLLSANAVWMIDDFTEENGGTRYVPGSHKLRTVPDSRQTTRRCQSLARPDQSRSCTDTPGIRRAATILATVSDARCSHTMCVRSCACRKIISSRCARRFGIVLLQLCATCSAAICG